MVGVLRALSVLTSAPPPRLQQLFFLTHRFMHHFVRHGLREHSTFLRKLQKSATPDRLCVSQGLNQLQSYLVLYRYLEGEAVPLEKAPTAEQLQAAVMHHLQERSNLLACIQAVLLYAQGT